MNISYTTKGFYAIERKWEIILQSVEERRDWLILQVESNIQPMGKFKEELADLNKIIPQMNRTIAMFDET